MQSNQIVEELISQVIEHTKKKLSPDVQSPIEIFVKNLFANVPPIDLERESVENLCGTALSLWESLQTRQRDAAIINVFNPKQEVHGWKSSHSVIEIVNDDMPFLVDSVTLGLQNMGKEVLLTVHPTLYCKRDEKGNFVDFCHREDDNAVHESVIHILVTEQTEEGLVAIKERIKKILSDVRLAVTDWTAMKKCLNDHIVRLEDHPPPLDRTEIENAAAFLRWILDQNFTLLGIRDYNFEGEGPKARLRIQDNALGILKDKSAQLFDVRDFGDLPHEVQAFMVQPSVIRISKANRRSSVHRPVYLDAIALKRFDDRGKVTGETSIAGLFTSSAYASSPMDIPLINKKAVRCVERAGFKPSSHDEKNLVNIIETYPRDELFQITEQELFDTAIGILHLQGRRRIELFVRKDPFERYISALVYIPRDRFDTALRTKVGQLIAKAYNGVVSAFFIHVADSPLARVHFIVSTTRGSIPDVDVHELATQLRQAGRAWEDRLKEALIDERGEEQGVYAMDRLGQAFSIVYQECYSEIEAVSDMALVEKALDGDGLAMNLHHPLGVEGNKVHFKIFLRGRPVLLSDVLPMLENMGLKVLSENPYQIKAPGVTTTDQVNHKSPVEASVWMHDFVMETEDGTSVDIQRIRDPFHSAFAAIWNGRMENDGFNRLVATSALSVRQVTILRAYCKYLLQARIPFSQRYMEQTLASNPAITALLVAYFERRFLPQAQAESRSEDEIFNDITTSLEQVSNLDEDRIIRRYRNVIKNTLRSNVAQTDRDGKPKSYLSLKIDSGQISDLPLPRPYREIFVYSPMVEGVHLRFGVVARGGLRWSDRREDFRTEILGLVKAQQVKNSVIVPVGSKGGFVVKNNPPASAGREAFLENGIACYKTFVRGLLDITDNLDGGKVVPPADVIRHDQDDPYLVVAADKGTASFSDIANGISADYGFWLGDAFASGGSAGYDHKGMGITAKGAWESVKRHFRELGKDAQSEDFTVVGIGDMAGDVFGNGMLLSQHIRLIAAFNHLHIFVDPHPDAATSWQERKRLFESPRSSWMDYDQKLISQGGGIFERSAKSIPVSPEMKKALAIGEDELPPNQLIRAILKSRAELLWFGGIGTYVKSSQETNAEAGDRANDSLRLNAGELRCKVVGEGANLGMTQLARTEFAMIGGKVNADFLDNSAGVDCSDHEVNIKILLSAVVKEGDMTLKQRDKLLAKMTDEVSDLVLRDNYLQSQAISVTEAIGGRLLDRTARYMHRLEKQGVLNRAIEFLPDDEDIQERLKKGQGLERPELATMLSYAKIALYDQLLSSDLPDDNYMERKLVDYFPSDLRKKYARQISEHRLRREIIATVVTNEMINRVGIAFVHEVSEKTGKDPALIARAYYITQEVFKTPELFDAIEALDNKVAASTQARMLADCGRLTEQAVVWFLCNGTAPLSIDDEIEAFKESVGQLQATLEDLMVSDRQKQFHKDCNELAELSVPMGLAKGISALSALASAGDICKIARRQKLSVQDVGKAYFIIGNRFGFDWLRDAAARLPSESAWNKLAVTAIIDDLFGLQFDLTNVILSAAERKSAVEKEIEHWAKNRTALTARTEQILAELSAVRRPDLAMLAVANRQLKNMIGS